MTNATAFNPGLNTADMPLAIYQPGGRGRIWSMIFAFLFCVGGGIAALYGAARANLRDDDRYPLMIIGAVCVLIGWFLVERWLRTRNLSVAVTTDGLTHNNNGKVMNIRWDEIAGVWQAVTKRYYNGVYTGTTHIYTVQTSDGKKMKFTDVFKNVEGLGDTIQREVTNRHLPRAIETYNSGGTVTFGNISVNRNGLSKGGKTLAWNEIQGVQIQKGYVNVKQQGRWLRWANIPVSSIPNMLVFLTLIDRIVGVNSPNR